MSSILPTSLPLTQVHLSEGQKEELEFDVYSLYADYTLPSSVSIIVDSLLRRLRTSCISIAVIALVQTQLLVIDMRSNPIDHKRTNSGSLVSPPNVFLLYGIMIGLMGAMFTYQMLHNIAFMQFTAHKHLINTAVKHRLAEDTPPHAQPPLTLQERLCRDPLANHERIRRIASLPGYKDDEKGYTLTPVEAERRYLQARTELQALMRGGERDGFALVLEAFGLPKGIMWRWHYYIWSAALPLSGGCAMVYCSIVAFGLGKKLILG